MNTRIWIALATLALASAEAPAQFSPYGPGGWGGYPYIQTPANGYLTGGASVIQAQSQFMTSKQDANIKNQQFEQSKLDTKRKAFDEYLYERKMTPTLEEERARNQQQQVMRALNVPPITEITSGKSLNDLLVDLQSSPGAQGPRIPLDPDTLRQINVTTGVDSGNIGLLKNTDRLQWPLGLETLPGADKLRERIDSLIARARSQSMGGRAEASTIVALKRDIDDLEKQLKKQVTEMEPMAYIDSKRFIHDLEASVEVLQKPTASQYLSGNYSAQGRTVDELVHNMSSKGLRFAPAVPGEEGAYVSLYNAVAAYDRSVHPSNSFKVVQGNNGGKGPTVIDAKE